MSNPTSSVTRPIVTLTTDFGTRDSYVAQMKGVIFSRSPDAVVVDVTHDIPRHDVVRASDVVAEAALPYPAGSVHVVVVDPGVGSARAIVGVAADGRFFVGPDNGVFARVYDASDDVEVVRVENRDFRRPVVSGTFHGRDVMAPAAAALAVGVGLGSLGPVVPAAELVRPRRPAPKPIEGGFEAVVTHVDHFGNSVTNLAAADLRTAVMSASVGSETLAPVTHYAEAGRGDAVTLVGSGGFYEVAVREGSAADRFGLVVGSPVRFLTTPEKR
ncbi:MAG: SAM-dependent chlorinase/fluorinase [Planctomycetota bacterium]